MLSSKKLTFSLTSLLVLIAFSFAYVVSPVMAHDVADEATVTAAEMVAGRTMKVWLSVDEAVQDVSSDDGIQIPSGRTRMDRSIAEIGPDTVASGAGVIIVLATFETEVHLQVLSATTPVILNDGTASTLGALTDGAITADQIDTISSAAAFGADDVVIDAFDNEGRNLGTVTLLEVLVQRLVDGDRELDDAISIIKHKNPGGRIPGELPSKEFLIQMDHQELENVYQPGGRGGGVDPEAGLEIHTLYFSIAAGQVTEASRDAIIRQRTGKHVHTNPISAVLGKDDANPLRVDLVDDDEGDPNYDQIRGTSVVAIADVDTTSDDGVPGVVYITAPNIVVRGAFYAHILLTEQPHENTFSVIVDGGQGTAGDPEWLTTVAPEELTGTTVSDIPGGYGVGNGWTTTAPDDTGTYDTGAYGTAEPDDGDPTTATHTIPQATGRDNMYHLYRVMVTPTGGATGDITVSVGQFDDKVLPLPNTYLPLTVQQRRATTFLGATETARVTRITNMRETLTVPLLGVADDTTSKVALATAAYKTRQEDILDKVANEITLGNKLVIPAGGYLVITASTRVNAGIADPAGTLKAKVSAAQKLYNVSESIVLPFPADDLGNFFRNGGTLNLGYADITAATDSGHDDSKATPEKDGKPDTGHDDYTGYDGATTDAYAKGAVIINEIMWGLDAGATTSQYIELHNTSATAAVTIDSKEWVIAVGSLPTGYAAIDTVSNNPASGYWAVPGNGGVTVASVLNPTVIDLVSMSRVTGATDGTAAASWAASGTATGTGLQSLNLSGRRIGTPGAANVYVMPAAEPEPEPEPVTPAAAVAKAGDLMISEIMVASNDGRLPQWIEIANVSDAAVSVSGWSLEVDNDSADPNVVGAGDTIVIDLGDVEIGADQVALVVTKEGRDTSGIGDGEGDLRADRIIDVQSDVSPDNARYSLISEMGFMISLIPPQTGAVRKPGDLVGNLEGGWELPASEGDRSSLIRREMGEAGEIMGTDAAGWVLASDTMLDGAYLTTYYGHADDMGTPGYNAGGNLPVELSKFGAKRDPLTGAVVITWSTQSELNNAGFFIKRSQQKKGKFVVVNPTMIAGAGTTAEKQSYTYTDATADPNVIYYYQIEDVSLDGNRQTLTRAHRLKGHIGAAGKATTTWGDLKSSRD